MRTLPLWTACTLALGAIACVHQGEVNPQRSTPAAAAEVSASPASTPIPRSAPGTPVASLAAHTPAAPPAPPAPVASGAPVRAAVASAPGDFEARVRPILEARCQPCHFAGGKVYAALPFDRPQTVVLLREKLFTRIKDEPSRRSIRDFLAAHPAPP